MESDAQSLTREQQADKLLQEGLAADRGELLMRLDHIGFYRMNGYAHTFRERGDNGAVLPRFRPGTTLRDVWDCYRFDRSLRLLFLDAIERIEVSLRSQLAYLHTQQNGAYAYADAQYFPKWKGYVDIWKRVRFDSREVNRARPCATFTRGTPARTNTRRSALPYHASSLARWCTFSTTRTSSQSASTSSAHGG